MAVPKKRTSKQVKNRRKAVWFKQAFESGARAFSYGILLERNQGLATAKAFEGFGKKNTLPGDI
jgi:Ribosomal L32p protein family